jgi:tetratricopeptide (TPR) repeat protein
VRAAKYAPRSPCHVLERCHGLADIVERGAVVVVERLRVIHPHSERDIMTLPKNALRHGQYFAQHRLGFFEAFFIEKGRRVVAPETDETRMSAMTALSNGLAEVGRYDEELTVLEAKYAYLKRNGGRISHIDVTMTNLAVCYSKLGRREEALTLRREVYARSVALRRPEIEIVTMALNLAHSLVHTGRYDEARSLSREKLPVARRALGNDHPLVFKLRGIYAETFLHDESSTRGDLDEAVSVVEDVIQRSQRVFGAAHPETQNKLRLLKALKTERSSRA